LNYGSKIGGCLFVGGVWLGLALARLVVVALCGSARGCGWWLYWKRVGRLGSCSARGGGSLWLVALLETGWWWLFVACLNRCRWWLCLVGVIHQEGFKFVAYGLN